MNGLSRQERAVELLQQLGLKEYEARSFVALSRLPRGTAKRVSEVSDVPRTRVYDAVAELEERGLVETQHSNPKVFRALPIDEAVATIREEYERRTAELRETLRGLEPVEDDDGPAIAQEVWSLSGSGAIATRAAELVGGAEREVVMVVGRDSAFDEELAERLRGAVENGVDVVVGTATEGLRGTVEAAVPGAEVFVSGLELFESDLTDDDTEIGRLLLVDREAILVSSVHGGGDRRRPRRDRRPRPGVRQRPRGDGQTDPRHRPRPRSGPRRLTAPSRGDHGPTPPWPDGVRSGERGGRSGRDPATGGGTAGRRTAPGPKE